MLRTSLILLLAASAFAQSTTSGPRFEVASIRPTSLADTRQRNVEKGTRISGRHVDMVGFTMNYLLKTAFRMNPGQIVGAPIGDTDHWYEIHALMPEGATPAQIPEMLRALLEERFHLRAHRQTTEQQAWALVAVKKPPSITPSREIDRSLCAAWTEDPNTGNESCRYGPSLLRDTDNGNKSFSLDAKSPWGPLQITTVNRIASWEYLRVTMADLADALSTHLSNLSDDPDRPFVSVVDRTGIEGEWDVTLSLDQSDLTVPALAYYSTALAKIGLKLEKTTAPVEKLIVDSFDKVPTGN